MDHDEAVRKPCDFRADRQLGIADGTNYAPLTETETYEQTGSVVDVESVTVPAGTFSALKLQSTVTWTDSQGTTRTETVTNWRDTATSHSVKENITVVVGGTPPTTGYPVSRKYVLESISQ